MMILDGIEYRKIPGYSQYYISNDGRLYNSDRDTFITGSRNPAGYVNYRLTNDDGICLTTGRHRAVALAWLPIDGPTDNLTVNHINAVKGDDRSVNLEWTTYTENQHHAGAMGLTSKCTPISVRDADTGIVSEWPSAIAYARHVGYTKDTVLWRTKGDPAKVWPDGKQYAKGHKVEFPKPDHGSAEVSGFGRSNRIYCRRLDSGHVTAHNSMRELASDLGVSEAAISTWVRKPNQPVLPGLIQLKLASDPSPWRKVTDMYKELAEFTKHRPVVVIDTIRDIEKIYESARQCAMTMGIKPTALHHRLQSDGKTVFSDGCRFCYYDVFKNGPLLEQSNSEPSLTDGDVP